MKDHGQYEKGESKRKWLLRLFREFLGSLGKKYRAERRIKQVRFFDDAFIPHLHATSPPSPARLCQPGNRDAILRRSGSPECDSCRGSGSAPARFAAESLRLVRPT